MKFTPGAHQEQMIEFALEHERCNLWAGMGMGKTSSALTVLNALHAVEGGVDLVIAPLRVARGVWPAEASKWDHLSDIGVVPVIGTAPERAAALKRDGTTYTINYENLPWLIEHHLDKKIKWRFRNVVADESTRLKSFRLGGKNGRRARAIARVAHTSVIRWINLTGTPAPNGLKDLWAQAWFVDAGVRLGRTYTSFLNRWFRSSYDGFGVEPLPIADREIHDKLRDVSLTLEAKDYFDIDEPISHTIYVDLPRDARRRYNEMEKEMFTSIAGSDIEAFHAAARTIKCLQLANGAAYIDDDAKHWREVHDEKIQALESLVEESAGAPVLVAYHFRSDLDRLRRGFPRGCCLDDRPGVERDWNLGKIPILFVHPASAGHGINLQDGGNILVFFGHWWNLEEYQQVIERIGPVRQMQSGHPRPVHVYHIVARDTVDEIVMARRESKREVQELLLEAMKRKGL